MKATLTKYVKILVGLDAGYSGKGWDKLETRF